MLGGNSHQATRWEIDLGNAIQTKFCAGHPSSKFKHLKSKLGPPVSDKKEKVTFLFNPALPQTQNNVIDEKQTYSKHLKGRQLKLPVNDEKVCVCLCVTKNMSPLSPQGQLGTQRPKIITSFKRVSRDHP